MVTVDERAEEADWKAAKRRAEQVDVCVDALTWQERAAIQRHIKAKRVGGMNAECDAQVWRDPHACILPAAHASYQSAKAGLYSRLKQRGLLAQAVCA
ncbi:hypothetical protein [Burkholderia contaminans]|uniref:hypothetical protein n=1 Tax=Burkholderia contaminans TaxID=488447 RepID=UPI0020C5E8B6|nr:hypothetical protein [Burkholderia contaminans]